MPSNLEILAYEETSLGPLCLRRRELLSQPGTIVTEVTLNHEFLMSSYNTDSERAISNRAIEIHGGGDPKSGGLKTLVGGLGLGYTAYELVKSDRISCIDVVEFLPDVIDWMRNGMLPLSKELNCVDRLRIIQGDVYQKLANPAEATYDLIIIDVDHSPQDQLGEVEHLFYTTPGLTQAKSHLNTGGVLAVWSYAESSAFVDSLHQAFDVVKCEPIKTVNTLVGHEQTDWLFFGVN